jgi:hypothetical protein
MTTPNAPKRITSMAQSMRSAVPTQLVVPPAPVKVPVNLYVWSKYAGAVSAIEPFTVGVRFALHDAPPFSSTPVNEPEVALVDDHETVNPTVVNFPVLSDRDVAKLGSTVMTQLGGGIKHWFDEVVDCCSCIASILEASPKTVAYKLAKTLEFTVSADASKGNKRPIMATSAALFMS